MAMKPKRKRMLLIVLSIVIGSSIAAALIFYAMRDNLNLFYKPAEIAAGAAPINKRIRAGGMVKKGSIVHEKDGLTVHFVVTDFHKDLTVTYKGILPALFAEDAGTVVAGHLQKDGSFIADQVLAKHDENYMPPEIADEMKDKPYHHASKE